MSQNPTYDYDLAVFIGRLQPPHLGHLKVIGKALEVAERVLVLVGSSNVAPDSRNPFSFEERHGMICDAMGDFGLEMHRVSIRALPDSPYSSNDWIERVQASVRDATSKIRPRVVIIGHERDSTSTYLRWFPSWDNLFLDDEDGINATQIRRAMFDRPAVGDDPLIQLVAPSTLEFLQNWSSTPVALNIRDELHAEDQYKKQWGKGPHVTVDAVVLCKGHILMIKRGKRPGLGAWALPGGFLEVDRGETLKEASMRELIEETSIFASTPKAPGPAMAILPAAYRACQTFDDPNRSRRGRIITHAYLYDLGSDTFGLPYIKAADDAAEAKWVPLSEIDPRTTFEDHAFVVDALLKYLR